MAFSGIGDMLGEVSENLREQLQSFWRDLVQGFFAQLFN